MKKMKINTKGIVVEATEHKVEPDDEEEVEEDNEEERTEEIDQLYPDLCMLQATTNHSHYQSMMMYNELLKHRWKKKSTSTQPQMTTIYATVYTVTTDPTIVSSQPQTTTKPAPP